MPLIRHLREDIAEGWRKFWNQPNKTYRNFQIVFGLLALHFFFPALNYGFAPQSAIDMFRWMGSVSGGPAYPFSEDGFVWRVLASGNVLTLAFMCFLLMANVRRFYAVLVPLCFMKGCASLGFLLAFVFGFHFLPFLGVAVWDGINVVLFLYFAHTAYWSLEEWGEETAVPRLFWKARDK